MLSDRLVPFRVLQRETLRLAREDGLHVHVRPLPAALLWDHWGATDRLRIYFPPSAPLGVVAHELAHVVTPRDEPEHGAVWAAHAARFAARLTHV